MWVALGSTRFDITHRALVMGILNRTTDSFFDKGTYWDFDSFLRRAERLVEEGADFLDVGGVKAGPGPEVTESEELERVVPAMEALRARFDVPLSIDTWRASVAEACYAAGACVGNDISGFADPDYLPVAARAGASVVATHIRLRPRVADPEPTYPRGVRAEVRDFLLERARQAMALGIARERVIIDAGLDLGKTWQQSLVLLRASSELADTGFALLLSASNKTFLGKLLDQEIDQRRESSLSATALGIAGGCRLIRAHDVAGTRRVVLVMEAILQARTERGLPLWRSHNEASSAVPEQPEQSEQPEQPGQPGQPEQPERSEQSEQSEQSERVG
jgi:dihydropteroate synthase